MTYLLLLIGFIFLIKGADLFVDGASALAKYMRVPPIIIGLTIVAMGTGAPEMSVSLLSALEGNGGIAVGNIIGSNLINLLCIGGLAAFLMPMKVKDGLIRREIPLAFLSSLLFVVFAVNGSLSITEGLIFLLFFSVFLTLLFFDAAKARKETKNTAVSHISPWKSILLILIGLGGIILGGDFVVKAATAIAYGFGLSQALVGLTIVALGTSLPELTTTLMAAKKGENDIAMGNIIGSNLFNICMVLGLSSVIKPIEVASFVMIDGLILTGATVLLFIFLFRDKTLRRFEGLAFFLLYLVYLLYIIARG